MDDAANVRTGTEAACDPAEVCERPRAPIGLLAELTYRCPLQCPYCSNPLEMSGVREELSTSEWQDVLKQAADLGVLQLHLSGGEPCVRQDLELILGTAVKVGLYTNLITSGVTLSRDRLMQMADIGLDHVQLSIQDVDERNAEFISAYKGGFEKKRQVARWVKELGLPLTINVVVHRHNIENLPALIDFAVEMGAGRIEVANVQYYAWALKNRAALIPTRAQFMRSLEIAKEAQQRLKGILLFDVVAHDHYAVRPKPCMSGWGRSLIDITPTGKVLPCHACETIPGLEIDNVRQKPLAEIWLNGPAFQKFRGTSWMKEPCRSCERREIDWGGCRCQALAFTGDPANADPACELSAWHKDFVTIAEREAAAPSPPFIYRRIRQA
ncbi:pyrroloquinoline quinone biosynthesis protein PqqE [Hyphomicrobium denitrificans 1NES1]|uniref:PqqA peptide cyclase n=1 Tax=Hyphomicrobium denitrificans 1NES1 TaxID=670307 RepID=N0B1J6_9HYPH|nr:pyrroloquinoline quinone biosynthesis protein PqqE [Hyphomicrobium denitrificans]AGK57359.1 pyrroloquinoline quinone biosynthesis protein PqqE [Hyphomicrobium denitrificans 1NES1]